MGKSKGALPRKKRKTPEHVKRAADRALARSAGKDPYDCKHCGGHDRHEPGCTLGSGAKPASPLDPPETPKTPSPKIGRPTKYRAAFCDRVMALAAQGMGKAEIAAELGTERHSLNEWAKKHPQFSTAMRCAESLSLAWWERAGRAGINAGKDFNAAAFCFQMKNRFRDDYCDRTETKHTLDASQAFLQMVQHISGRAMPKLIEGKPA